MSAFFVGDDTIDNICTLLVQVGPCSVDFLTETGRAMLHNNADAIVARYRPKGSNNPVIMAEVAGYRTAADAYSYTPSTEPAGALFKSLRVYLYQCEEGTVHQRPLHQVLVKLADKLEHLEQSPAYQAAQWG